MEFLILLLLGVGVWILWLASSSGKSSSQARRTAPRTNSPDVRIEVSVERTGGWSEPTSQNLRGDFEKFWIRRGKSVTVQGFVIQDGLIYIGANLAGAHGYQIEPALINPELDVDRANPDHDGQQMNYWPSYSEISPSCRAAYLSWLAGGRKDPNTYIGYVFLYFYGLERRVLYDCRKAEKKKDEYDAILNEVRRLLRIYGDNGSFAGYAQNFLFKMYLGSGVDRDLTSTRPVVSNWSSVLPAPLKIGLGQFSKLGKPIPDEWALAWVLQDPEIRLRVPARRCRKEFEKLFKLLYRERHGDGIVVKPNKTPISATYRPASPGMQDAISIYEGPVLPDITVLKRPRTMLADLADQATDKLDAYSRFVGKDRRGWDSLQGLALLPTELDGYVKHAGLEDLRSFAESCLNGRKSVLVSFEDLMEYYPVAQRDKMTKKEAVLFAQLLEKLGLGMEPDVRFSWIKPTPNNRLVIFRQVEDAPSAPSQAFEAAVLLMRLAAMVSAADGEVSPDEQRHLEEHVETSLSLASGERQRLHAHIRWLLVHEHQSMAGLKPKLEALAEPQRQSIGEFLVTVAAADGRIDPGEIKILQKLYMRLGLDPDQVVSVLHNFTAEPVTVKPATPRSGYTLPQPSDQSKKAPTEPGRRALDPAALQKKLSETARVSELLHGVFGEEDMESDKETSGLSHQASEQNILSLDAEHSALLRALGARETWKRSELELLAENYELLPDGALETINELAFDHCDGLCIEEDDDNYVIDRDIYEEITT